MKMTWLESYDLSKDPMTFPVVCDFLKDLCTNIFLPDKTFKSLARNMYTTVQKFYHF